MSSSNTPQLRSLLSAFDAFGKPAEGDTGIEVLRNAGMDFEVEMQPIYRSNNGGAVKDGSRYRRVTRTDTQATLGVVSQGFVPYQPREMAGLAETIVGAGRDVDWDRVGCTHGGARMMMSFQLPDTMTFGNGDATEEVATYFYVMNAHDGSSGLKIVPAPVRLFCSNQFPMLDGFLRKQGINPKALSIRHSSKMHDRIDDVLKALNIIDSLTETFAQQTADLLQVDMDIGSRVEYYIKVMGLVTDPECVDPVDNPHGLKTRGKNTLDTILEAEALARNNIGDMSNTAFQAWTTITDHLTHAGIHGKDGKILQSKLESAVMGSSAKKMNDAWEILDNLVVEASAEAIEVVA